MSAYRGFAVGMIQLFWIFLDPRGAIPAAQEGRVHSWPGRRPGCRLSRDLKIAQQHAHVSRRNTLRDHPRSDRAVHELPHVLNAKGHQPCKLLA